MHGCGEAQAQDDPDEEEDSEGIELHPPTLKPSFQRREVPWPSPTAVSKNPQKPGKTRAMTRRIPFEAIDNFRDFGDYAAGQRRLRRGLLYRSASQSRATDADLEKLAGLGLAVIVDLRRLNEREREPSRRWAGFGARVIENDIGQEAADEWATFIQGSDLTPGSFRDYMLEYYRHLPHQRRHHCKNTCTLSR